MPWKTMSEMDEKLRFVVDLMSGAETMTMLCERHGISRQTGYVLAARYRAEGVAGLLPRSRAPHRHGRATAADLVVRILDLRRAKPHWGPKKLLAVLAEADPGQAWPAHATVSEILRREGLSLPRRVRRRPLEVERPFAAVAAPNDAWCIDFKGWFTAADGARCDPFTATDAYSRYLLGLSIVPPTGERVGALMDALFQEHGVPAAIRSDNGAPFASVGAGGLTRLSARWAKMGIALERIQPGKPQQNGRHERMHRTLKAEACRPPSADIAAQQRRFDAFRAEFNTERPHEALGQRRPASVYVASSRPFVAPEGDPDYGADDVRRVRSDGSIKWGNAMLFVSEALVGEAVGIARRQDGHWLVRFAAVPLGLIDGRTGRLARFGPGRPGHPETIPNPSPDLSDM